MSHFDQGEFGRGRTFCGPVNTVATSGTLPGVDLLGVEKWFTDTIPGSAPTGRSKRKVLCRLVRNSSGITLLPKRGVSFKAGTNGTEVDGYTRTTGQGDYAVTDEYLPAAGVRNGDVFWVVMKGPAIVTTTMVADATCVIPAAELVIASTAAASTAATTAGRFEVYAIASPTTAGIALQNHKNTANALGRAMSAKTTANTNADILIDVQYHS
jgi:hypothetical protein